MLSLKNKRTHFLLNLGAWGNVFQPAMLSSREEKHVHPLLPASLRSGVCVRSCQGVGLVSFCHGVWQNNCGSEKSHIMKAEGEGMLLSTAAPCSCCFQGQRFLRLPHAASMPALKAHSSSALKPACVHGQAVGAWSHLPHADVCAQWPLISLNLHSSPGAPASQCPSSLNIPWGADKSMAALRVQPWILLDSPDVARAFCIQSRKSWTSHRKTHWGGWGRSRGQPAPFLATHLHPQEVPGLAMALPLQLPASWRRGYGGQAVTFKTKRNKGQVAKRCKRKGRQIGLSSASVAALQRIWMEWHSGEKWNIKSFENLHAIKFNFNPKLGDKQNVWNVWKSVEKTIRLNGCSQIWSAYRHKNLRNIVGWDLCLSLWWM